MINEIRELALRELNHRFGCNGVSLEKLREEHARELAPFLVEASEKIARVYLLQAVPEQPDKVRVWPEELDGNKHLRLPFNKPSGSQSAALGPVFKRTYKPKDQPPYGPSLKIQNTTREAFQELAKSDGKWNRYFNEIYNVLFHGTILLYEGKCYEVGAGKQDPHILAAAVRLIPEKTTVFLGMVDSAGHWPGDRPEYHAYLAHALADSKYITGEAPAHHGLVDCPLCGKPVTILYPNALKGAGINFNNMDRAGAFPSLDTEQAWKGYGLCLDCADLLYIFKNHLLDQFLGRVAGERALVLPGLLGNEEGRRQFMQDWRGYIKDLESRTIKDQEKELMEFFLGQDDAHVVLHILWAKFGQVVDDISGYVTDILPSRLQALARLNAKANSWPHALAPRHVLEDANFDLPLSMLNSLFKRPGGKKAEKANNSARLFGLKRQLAEALYHGAPLGDVEKSLWKELLTTARWYVDQTINSGNDWGLLNEGFSEKGNKQIRYWTLAGWIRHLARFLYYLDITGTRPMEQEPLSFEPRLETLKPYFKPGSGINSREKAFTFLLGILYGKLLQVQGARGVNVASNALTWLKRLELSGRDLPALYTKIREKLLVYETESNPEVRALIQEIGRLGALLGDAIALDSTTTCYFLLLGQSVTTEVLPSKPKKEEDQR
jgi:CRISPR-associated protein Csh1